MQSLRGFFITLLIALLVFGVCAYFISGFVTDSLTGLLSGDTEEEVTTADTDVSGETLAPVVEDDVAGESFNVLLVGTDYRPSILGDYHPNVASQYPKFNNSAKLIGTGGALPEYPYRTVHADAVVLVCVNKEKQAFTYLQIPSSMQLTIGGVTTTVAELYYDKGLDYFVNKMSGITGVQIDYYAVTSIEQVANVVDAMGKITYTVPCDMQYTDEISGLNISLAAGAHTLGGKDVAGLLAFDAYTNPALSREKTMLSFLQTLAQKMTNITYLNKAAGIFANVSRYVYTNFTSADLAANLDLIFKYGEYAVNTVEYPGSYYYREGVRYFNPNLPAAITTMSKYK